MRILAEPGNHRYHVSAAAPTRYELAVGSQARLVIVRTQEQPGGGRFRDRFVFERK
jgi:hypothetical protein